jgi:hypothetical protein
VHGRYGYEPKYADEPNFSMHENLVAMHLRSFAKMAFCGGHGLRMEASMILPGARHTMINN